MPITVLCSRCGKTYTVPPYLKSTTMFCSNECKKNRVTLRCLHCNNTYSVIAARQYISKFCCIRCHNTYQAHHISPETIKKRQNTVKQQASLMTDAERKLRWAHPPVLSESAKHQISISKKINNPMYRADVREKVSKTLKERHSRILSASMTARHQAGDIPHPPLSLEQRKCISIRMTNNNPMHNADTRLKVSATFKKKYADPVYRKNRLSILLKSPNKPEKHLTALCLNNNLPFEYVGDGSFWIGPCSSGKCRNPDFIHKNHNLKKAILVNGRFWHPPENVTTELKDYASAGYNVLVLWEDEVYSDDVNQKINDFLGGASCVG